MFNFITYFDLKFYFHLSAFNYPNIVQIKIIIEKYSYILLIECRL